MSNATEPFDFLIGDFPALWNSIARIKVGNRANYIFGLMPFVALEWACRICAQLGEGPSGTNLTAIAKHLASRDQHYFTQMPGLAQGQKRGTPPKDVWHLPPSPIPPSAQKGVLLWVLFDLVRNGHAHKYDAGHVILTDSSQAPTGEQVQIALPGPPLPAGRAFFTVKKGMRNGELNKLRAGHLAFDDAAGGRFLSTGGTKALVIRVHPLVLYLDVKWAIQTAGIPAIALELPSTKKMEASIAKLAGALASAGHPTFNAK